MIDLSKGQTASVYIGLFFLVVPYAVYFYSRATGLLPSEQEWWNRGINHGPWWWEWQMAFILPGLYIFFLGSVVLLLVGCCQALLKKSVKTLFVYFLLAATYISVGYLQVKTVFWTID